MIAFIERCREWQKQNPDWELICDIEKTDSLYFQWAELPRKEKMHWIGKYRDAARDAFEEFATKQCKVDHKVLDSTLQLHEPLDWPHGHAMAVYRTKVDGVSLL